MSLLEECPCSNRKELITRERFFFDTLENINIRRPIRKEEDKEAIANETSVRVRMYRDTHKKERTKYRLNNKEKIAGYAKKYREKLKLLS